MSVLWSRKKMPMKMMHATTVDLICDSVTAGGDKPKDRLPSGVILGIIHLFPHLDVGKQV